MPCGFLEQWCSHFCIVFWTIMIHCFLCCLQFVQDTAVRLVTKNKRKKHITPVLTSLLCPSVRLHIDFKILLLTFKALIDLAPKCISDSMIWDVNVQELRSTDIGLLTISRTQFVTEEYLVFSVLWNCQLTELQQ